MSKLDIIKGFTTKGVHRDDFMIYINKKEIDEFALDSNYNDDVERSEAA